MNIIQNRIDTNGHTYFQWIFSIFANSTLFIYGMECGWVSPITTYLQTDASPTGHPLSDSEIAWIASSMSMAAMPGVPMCAFVADRYGRKTGIIVIAVLEAVSWIIRLSYSSFFSLMIARISGGLAAGGCFGVVPMYVKEISQDDLRGTLGIFTILSQTIGLFIIYVIGAYLDYYNVLFIVMALSLLTILMIIKAPESPEFLVKQGKTDKAIKTIALLTGLDKEDATVRNVFDNMMKEETHFKSLPDITLLSIMKNKVWLRGFIYILLTFTCFDTNGGYAIITYASSMLASTGVDFEIRPEVQTLTFPIVMIIGSSMLASCIEKFGRKPLLFGAFLVTSISMFTIAIITVVQRQFGTVPPWLPVSMMMLVVAMFSGGVCPIVFVILTEMFNFQIRAKIMGVVVTYSWFLSFIMLRIHAPISNYLGVSAPFIFYGATNLAGALFTIFFLTETKGRSEDEILRNLMRGKNVDTDNKI